MFKNLNCHEVLVIACIIFLVVCLRSYRENTFDPMKSTRVSGFDRNLTEYIFFWDDYKRLIICLINISELELIECLEKQYKN